jgi:regulator of sigma E protease
MNVLIAILGAIFAFFIVVLVHEFGHFIVARLVGIKVLRFSIGFGKPIYHFRGKSGVEYVIGILPLGGYVKMQDVWSADENEKLGSPGSSFESKSLLARMAVVLAGPIANFLLAVVLFTGVYMIGVTEIKPIVGEVTPMSAASRSDIHAGDQILQIGRWETHTWQQVVMALIAHIGDRKTLNVSVLPKQAKTPVVRHLNLQEWRLDPVKPELLRGLGIIPYFPPIPPVIGAIATDSPRLSEWVAEWGSFAFGKQSPDRFLAKVGCLGGRAPQSNHTPDDQTPWTVKNPLCDGRATKRKWGSSLDTWVFNPRPIQIPDDLKMKEQRSWFLAPWSALSLTSKWVVFHVVVLKQILVGKISIKTLSGPVSIFQAAGNASLEGFVTFLQFVAFISIVLGVFNLLPIPALDGGHFLFFLIEGLRGKPLSLPVQIFLINIGIVFLVMIMIYATMNDVIRLLQ